MLKISILSAMGLSLIFLSQISLAMPAFFQCKDMNHKNVTQCKFKPSQKISHDFSIINMPYALCSRALCTLLPNKKMSICVCDLENYQNNWKALSLSPKGFEKSKPTYDKKGNLKTVQSNYSMANIPNFHEPAGTTCHYQTPHYWANCYGIRCMVFHTGHGTVKNAVTCACPVFSNDTFMIGWPNVSYCGPQGGKVWSATKEKMRGFNPIVILYQELFPKAPPASLPILLKK